MLELLLWLTLSVSFVILLIVIYHIIWGDV